MPALPLVAKFALFLAENFQEPENPVVRKTASEETFIVV
jgi:hypothetical protein